MVRIKHYIYSKNIKIVICLYSIIVKVANNYSCEFKYDI